MDVLDLIGAVGSLGTAAGVVFVGAQLWYTRRQMVADFERTFVDRYLAIVDRIPLDILLGEQLSGPVDGQVERALYDYFELCEEEMYYRRAGRVSTATWEEWWAGISLHLRRPCFREVFDQLDGRAIAHAVAGQPRGEQFAHVRRAFVAIDQGRFFDPKD